MGAELEFWAGSGGVDGEIEASVFGRRSGSGISAAEAAPRAARRANSLRETDLSVGCTIATRGMRFQGHTEATESADAGQLLLEIGGSETIEDQALRAEVDRSEVRTG